MDVWGLYYMNFFNISIMLHFRNNDFEILNQWGLEILKSFV